MYLFRHIQLMVSKLVLCAVYGASGFLTCLLVKSLLTLRHQGLAELGMVRFTNPLAFSSDAANPPRLYQLPGHSSSPSQQHLCDQGDKLFALLSG